MSRIKIKSQKPIFKASHFSVQEAVVQDNQEERIFHHVILLPSVFVIPLTEKNEIYLLKHYRYTYDANFVEVVAGMIEPGEKPLATAKRELQEEAGLSAKKWEQLAAIETASGFIKTTKYYFLARELQEGKQNLEFSEEIEVFKIPINEAVAKVLSGEINAEKTITGILLVNVLLEQGKL